MLRLFIAIALLTLATLGPSTTQAAAAKPALLAVDDATPAVAETDDGYAATLDVTNVTDGALTLGVAPTGAVAKGCRPKLSRAALGSAQSAQVKVSFARSCAKPEEEFETTLTATSADDQSQALQLTAEVPEDTSHPDWDQLLGFVYAFCVGAPAIGALFLVLLNTRPIKNELAPTKPRYRLQYLEAAYSFKDSWVSNVTVIAGLLTAVFGSADVVKAFLGEDADSSIALATVGSAIALILIGAGPIMLNATKVQWVDEPTQKLASAFHVWGLYLATTATFVGAAGQLWVGWKSGRALDLGGAESWIWAGFLLSVGILIWATVTNVRQTLRAGLRPPPPSPPSDLAQLIELIRGELFKADGVPNETVPDLLESIVAQYPGYGVGRGDEPLPAQPRAAML